MSKRESKKGYHVWSQFHDCPWSWYLKYIMGWIPKYKSKALIKGSAIHEAMEIFYRTGNYDEMQRGYVSACEEGREICENPLEVDVMIDDGKKELLVWYNGFGGRDISEYDVLLLEEELSPKLQNGMELTVRPDRVLRNKTSRSCVIRETKTTSYSIESSYNGVKCEDQATCYIWALKQLHPEWNIDSVEVDVIYHRQSVTRCERPAPIFRSRYDLAQFELGVMGTMQELTSKVMALDKFPPQLLFPRHGRNCMKWGCEYEQICRTRPDAKFTPPGFAKDELIDFSSLKIGEFDIERLRA